MCGGPAWKREVVADHKFDFVDTREFTDKGFGMRMKYLWLYALVLKSFLVYITDIFTATTMLTTKSWSNQIFQNCSTLPGCVPIKFSVGKILFVSCIAFSFLLLGYEARKTKKIVASRDISYAFTNIMANHYYSLRSYEHFCFFDHISNSTTKKDDFAFFIFFTFKSWKRLLLADGPRQTINALTLWSIYLSKKKEGHWYDIGKYFPKSNNFTTSALTVSTFFTVVIFAGSLLLLIIAGVCYIPLLCYIRGNLKEFCCHKVDKRISQIIKRKNKERLAKATDQARKEARGDFSHLKNKKGQPAVQPLPQPTLPNLSVDDDFNDASSMQTRKIAPSTYTQDTYYASDYKAPVDYPPMPGYNYSYTNYSNPSFTDQKAYDDEYEGVANLAMAAAPPGQLGLNPPPPSPGLTSPYGNHYSADPHDVYRGHAEAELQQRPSQHRTQHSGEGAYDGMDETPSDPAPQYNQMYPGVQGQQQQQNAYGHSAYYQQNQVGQGQYHNAPSWQGQGQDGHQGYGQSM